LDLIRATYVFDMSCPDCTKGDVLPGEPTGSINTEFQGAYFSPAPESSSANKRYTVLLLTDAFGLPLKNCKIMADEMAKRLECDVWIPDYFNGGCLSSLLWAVTMLTSNVDIFKEKQSSHSTL